jgi:hypothetical protein
MFGPPVGIGEKLGKSLSLQPIQGLAVNSALGKISTGRVK